MTHPLITRHTVPDPTEIYVAVDDYRTHDLMTATAGKMIGVLSRHLTRSDDGGRVEILYDVRIDGFNDVGCGMAQLHTEDSGSLADLVAVASVLAQELAAV